MASAGRASLTTLEDPLVDRLVWRAVQRGCGAVIARTPRAAVDCNRAEDEVDPVGGRWRRARSSNGAGTRRARHCPGAHAAARLSVAARDQPGPARRADRPGAPAISRGDRGTARAAARPLRLRASARLPLDASAAGRAFRRWCSAIAAAAPPTGWISGEAMAIARRCGFDAGLNDPFAGGHVIERHARPARGVHALADRARPPHLSGPDAQDRRPRVRQRRRADRGAGGRAWRKLARPPVSRPPPNSP